MCAALKAALGDEYGMTGSGREKDGTGEINNVIYKKSAFELLESGTVWLTDTPKKYSALDGSNLPKIDGEWVSDHNAIVSELILYPTSKSLGTR